jgi:uncharacterized protein YjbJ (UPF0337 family)
LCIARNIPLNHVNSLNPRGGIMNKDRAEGKIKDIAGRAERQVGEWTGDTETQAKGTLKQAEGKVQNAWGKVKDAAEKHTDDAKARDEKVQRADDKVEADEEEAARLRREAS